MKSHKRSAGWSFFVILAPAASQTVSLHKVDSRTSQKPWAYDNISSIFFPIAFPSQGHQCSSRVCQSFFQALSAENFQHPAQDISGKSIGIGITWIGYVRTMEALKICPNGWYLYWYIHITHIYVIKLYDYIDLIHWVLTYLCIYIHTYVYIYIHISVPETMRAQVSQNQNNDFAHLDGISTAPLPIDWWSLPGSCGAWRFCAQMCTEKICVFLLFFWWHLMTLSRFICLLPLSWYILIYHFDMYIYN